MVFSSLTFLCVFLPAVLLLYYLSKNITYKNTILAVTSLIFYAWGEPPLLILLIAASLVNYFLALGIGACQKRDKNIGAKILVTCAIVFDIAMIGVFKYAAFTVSSINGVFGLSFPIPEIGLPLGISFYTFQILTYVLDVYRKDMPVQKSYLKFITFVSMFPQLIAGPIVRYQEVAEGLDDRKVTISDFADGATQFVIGLGKKVFLANFAGDAKDILFAASTAPTVLSAWLGIIFYSFQLYFDFSGYSDMAIGMGKMIGFKFPKNFNYPYISRSITEFWRRWHISLGTWFRDYVYIPLGGSRVKKSRAYMNILIVWMLTGLWHGAAWNFVIWGLYFAVLLIIEKCLLLKQLEKSRVWGHIYVCVLVILSFVIFNASSMGQAFSDIGGMFGAGGVPLISAEAVYYLKSYAVIFGLAIVGATPIPKHVAGRIKCVKYLEPIAVLALLVVITACLVDGSFNPFLYFRF